MSDSFARSAQRPSTAAGRRSGDRIARLLGLGDDDDPGVATSREDAITESDRLCEEAMRGDFGPWSVSRAIDLARQWPLEESLALNAGRLVSLGSDARSVRNCWRALVERFPRSDAILEEYRRALAKLVDEEVANAIWGTYRAGAARPDPQIEAEASLDALAELLDRALEWRRQHPPTTPAGPAGPIALIGGTLGGGGAERQLVNTALGLHARHSGGAAIGPVTVYCRKLDRRRGHDFYLPKLESAGITVTDYLRAEPFGGNAETSRLASVRPLLDELPHRMREGTVQLTEMLRHEAPEIAHIWQDGGIFAVGLAALIANVPRIILNVRTMPPTERADRRKPEQHALYSGLLRAPGVTLSANSAAAAQAYERWLGLATGSVAVIANGVDALPQDGGLDDIAKWDEFAARTGGGFTLGGVMRLDDNKRPLEWLRIAAALTAALPTARFVLVGTGPLRAAAQATARQLGIADRVLFAGRTRHVGFWLDRFDALALTSRHEGLPNVLIEAQLAGVPVVTAPAGGAAEAVGDHRTNCVLSAVDPIPVDEAIAHLAAIASRTAADSANDSRALALRAQAQYSCDTMIDRTIALFRQG